MYSQEYEEAKKEFVNCLVVGPFGLFVPYVLAFTEWWPLMKHKRKKPWNRGKKGRRRRPLPLSDVKL